MRSAQGALSAAGFAELYDRLRNGAGWGERDRRGALNHTNPAQVLAAARSVSKGWTVSLAAPIEHEPAADNPQPCLHQLSVPQRDGNESGGLEFATDSVTLHVHGNADSHFDALCHVAYDGTFYNDLSSGQASAAELSVDAIAARGIAGRGVLLDIPRLRGIDWLDPGDHVTAADLAAAARSQGLEVGTGDLLFVRVGHRRRRQVIGPWDAAAARAGLHPQAVELLAQWQVALLGSDGNSDTAPSVARGVDFPVHVLAIRALGLPLLDYLALEDLTAACLSAGRWSFMCVVAPLRLTAGTGSPVNPIALL
jgi:kynurenine formamidase